jgi:hypothetical protein
VSVAGRGGRGVKMSACPAPIRTESNICSGNISVMGCPGCPTVYRSAPVGRGRRWSLVTSDSTPDASCIGVGRR